MQKIPSMYTLSVKRLLIPTKEVVEWVRGPITYLAPTDLWNQGH